MAAQQPVQMRRGKQTELEHATTEVFQENFRNWGCLHFACDTMKKWQQFEYKELDEFWQIAVVISKWWNDQWDLD